MIALQSIYNLLLVPTSIFLNVIVMSLVARNKTLRTVSFGVSPQIVVLDLILTILVAVSLVSSIANQWVFGEVACGIVSSVVIATFTTRTLLLCCLVIDCFLSIFLVYSYPKFQLRIVVILSVMSWLIPVALGIPLLPLFRLCYIQQHPPVVYSLYHLS